MLREKHRFHYIFSGDVQGVGFRYTAQKAAQSCGITGWVRNAYDGTVEMEVQGYMQNISELLREIRNDMYINIENTDCHEIPLRDEKSFSIIR